jgi:hypothetical protein
MLGWVSALQAAGTAAFFLAQNYMVADLGWRWWYGLFAIFNGTALILSAVLVCETGYDRPDEASQGAVHVKFSKPGDEEDGESAEKIVRVTTADGNVLDTENYSPRTWKYDLKLFTQKPQWGRIPTFYKHLAQSFVTPTMSWVLLLNGAFLGLYVMQVSTFATILLSPPHNFAFSSLGFVQAGQVVDSIIFLPILGYGTDIVIKFMSKRNKNVYEPEYRIIVLIIPAIVGVICCVVYGQAGAHPYDWTWGTVAVTYNAIFFAFLGANIVGITYAIDSFPLITGPVLVLICSGRGFISFGLSYSTLAAVSTLGYDGTMNVYAIVTGVLSLLGIPCYFYGPCVRKMVNKWFKISE